MENNMNVNTHGNDTKLKLERMFKLWASGYSQNTSDWYKIDAFYVLTGKHTETDELSNTKTILFQLWLTGYYLSETLFVFTRDERVIVISSDRKLALLEQKKAHYPNMTLLMRNNEDKNASNLEVIKSHFNTLSQKVLVGTLDESVHDEVFFSQMCEFLGGYEKKFVPNLLSSCMSVLTSMDLDNTRLSGICVCAILKHSLISVVEDVLDEEKKETHKNIANIVDYVHQDTKLWQKLKEKYQINVDEVEIIYANVQSGKQFILKPHAEPNEEILSQNEGTIILSLGVKYQELCTNIVRTLFLHPNDDHKNAYLFTLDVLTHTIKHIKHGQKCSEVYENTKTYVRTHKPHLVDKLQKNVGHVLGFEFIDPQYILSPKNDIGILENGMALNISIAFNNLQTSSGSPFAIWVAETIIITANSEPTVLTELVSRRMEYVSYQFQDEQQTSAPSKPKNTGSNVSASVLNNAPSVIIPTRLRARGDQANSAMEAEQLMRLQRDLRKKKIDELKKRFADGENVGGSYKAKRKPKLTSIRCFDDVEAFPRDLTPNRLYVDPRSSCLFVPIKGCHIPFHVSTIKNVNVTSEEGVGTSTTIIRINFQVHGSQTMLSKGEESSLPDVIVPHSLFIKELLFKSYDHKHSQAILRNVKEMIKNVKTKETEEDIARDLADMEKLVLNRTGRRVLLKDLLVRPNIQGSRKIIGTLEAHTNGLRYTFNSRIPEYLDIIYQNIKYAFFQPCENELIVLIHFHLKSPILIGKKKTHDVQFYTETGTQADDLDNRRGGSLHDPDETQAEIREREMKRRLNTEFKRFVTQVEEISHIEFDIPVNGFMFTGVPGKSKVEIMPTANCLVHLIDWPPFVLPLEDIEIVAFERILHGLKEFDMTFVFKDYSKPVRRIDSISVSHLDNIKRWLNDLELVWYEVKNNLQWANICKEILSNIESFLDENGFESFLGDISEEEEEEEEEEEDDQEYEGSEEQSVSEDESEEDSEDESLVDESDDESFKEVESGEEEGLSWDELDEIAYKDDRKHLFSGNQNNTNSNKKPKI